MTPTTAQIFCIIALIASFAAASASPCSEKNQTSCDTCLSAGDCFWCKTTKECLQFEGNHDIPTFGGCALTEGRYKNCWLNWEGLYIGIGIICAFALILLSCCCCWCNRMCKRRRLAKMAREDQEMDRRASERNAEQEVKAAERRAKRNEMRQKYGLKREEGPPYERMEDQKDSNED